MSIPAFRVGPVRRGVPWEPVRQGRLMSGPPFRRRVILIGQLRVLCRTFRRKGVSGRRRRLYRSR